MNTPTSPKKPLTWKDMHLAPWPYYDPPHPRQLLLRLLPTRTPKPKEKT